MARGISLEQQARARFGGEPLDTLIPRLLSQEGTIHLTAVALGVYPNAIRHWCKSNGFEFRHSVRLVKRTDAP